MFMAIALLVGVPGDAAEQQPLSQPPEDLLHNYTATEKLAAVRDMLSWGSVTDLKNYSSSDEAHCRGMASDIAAGRDAKFLEPVAIGAVDKPAALLAIEQMCPMLNLDQQNSYRTIGNVYATRNFSLYELKPGSTGQKLLAFYAERWCDGNETANDACPIAHFMKVFDPAMCRFSASASFPSRMDTPPAGATTYVQGIVEYKGEEYFANVGTDCSHASARLAERYEFQMVSIKRDGGRLNGPELRCRLTHGPVTAPCAREK